MLVRNLAAVIDIGMTSGAVGPVRRKRPDDRLVIRGMTIYAECRCSVIAGVIGRIMAEQFLRRPARCVVTPFAIQRSNKMRGCFSCRRAAVMARGALAGNRVVIKRCAQPCCGVVAQITLTRGL